ncbi:DUF262 domain-containing protein [Methylobacterium sp. Leaf89]|uniref:DUF262 domain-containing protein n=1 Tax=Methylobacterium sp. Leaf89 TaxID=1736245 RepID=UPI0009EBDD20|nr:DUF262 domain-containing protein [Methylobacterium sp. Leaf89]
MSLDKEIERGALSVATDSYDMSVGELMNVYRDNELIVNPEFQRLFRWTLYQKSHFIESLLIGIPIPSIFVFEQASGAWELIDGLQRVSTILEFAGLLRNSAGRKSQPSVLQATRTLPSLANTTWDDGPAGTTALTPAQQISIKRARIGVQILKKTSDTKAKYDLFQRLNSHGSQANDQELRNCVIVMLNRDLFAEIKRLASDRRFKAIMQPSERGIETQALMDYVTRFLVFMFVDYDKRWDIEEYLNNGVIEIADEDGSNWQSLIKIFEETIDLVHSTGEPNILKRYRNGTFSGKVGQAGFEAIFLGVAQNRKAILRKSNPGGFVLQRAKDLWTRAEVSDFTKGGVRGTTRIQKTLPFGREWFQQ